MFLYLATSAFYKLLYIVKLGMTEDLYGRRSTYQTSCPPGVEPHSHDIDYEIVWETDATSRDQLFDYEEILHSQFVKWRMMRRIPFDSEWFNFNGDSSLEIIRDFMKTMPWVKREVPLSEIAPLKRLSCHLRKQHTKNTNFIRIPTKRNETLDQIQEPVIQAIQQFILNVLLFAGFIIAPCGSGKTLMTCKGIKGLKRVIICCPSNQIQGQWASTLINEGVFINKQILTMGSSDNGTTNQDAIRAFMQQDIYCVITTYMSSNLLVDILTNDTQILVLDEAHHLGGIVGKEGEGEGKTRRLMMKATELQVKRLSLTFTPRIVRIVRNDDNLDMEYASMDDTNIFGSQIAELKIRDLIRKGVLPHYRLWSLRDSSKKGSGILGKADCILESWEATQMVRGVEEPILHHLIVFTATNDEAKQLEAYFTNNTKDTLVLCVKGGDKLKEPIRKFSEAKRAIIVNCKVLGEGVDIPIANGVAVTYPKYSRSEITQMLLRAGRWYQGKCVFHILLPILDEEDMSGFQEVLTSLASCDDQLRDEIIIRIKQAIKNQNTPPTAEDFGAVPESIMIDDYDGSDLEEINKCFHNIRNKLFPKEKIKLEEIRRICIENNIRTSSEYNTIRNIYNFPETPWSDKMTAYDFFHSDTTERVSIDEFKQLMIINNISTTDTYVEWRAEQTESYPSVEEATEGYFHNIVNFQDLLPEGRRRR
jgi:superfamily II DNA or RNA helicase